MEMPRHQNEGQNNSSLSARKSSEIFWLGNLKGRDHSEDLGVDDNI
jgi:hypothetical protein